MLGAFVFTVPGTNAECERFFSLVGQYWTKDKSQLKVSTLESVMKVKIKIALTCDQFYEKIKENRHFLQKPKDCNNNNNNNDNNICYQIIYVFAIKYFKDGCFSF